MFSKGDKVVWRRQNWNWSNAAPGTHTPEAGKPYTIRELTPYGALLEEIQNPPVKTSAGVREQAFALEYAEPWSGE